jgi:hypothetical protein
LIRVAMLPPAKRLRTEACYREAECTDAAVQEFVRSRVVRLIYPKPEDAARRERAVRDSKLPGPLAATLSRSTLRVVADNQYSVCEKSDGERRMLFAWSTPTPRACFVDRKFRVFILEDCGAKLAAMWCERGDTLMDGELVLRPGAPAAYNVFDVIAINGDNGAIGQRHLGDRLRCIGERIRIPFREWWMALEKERSTPPSVRLPSHCCGFAAQCVAAASRVERSWDVLRRRRLKCWARSTSTSRRLPCCSVAFQRSVIRRAPFTGGIETGSATTVRAVHHLSSAPGVTPDVSVAHELCCAVMM